MTNTRQKITLARQASYQITVPGKVNGRWSNWFGEMSVMHEIDRSGQPRTILTVTVDQATLQGLLRRLYVLGFPLISIRCLDCVEKSPGRDAAGRLD